MTPSFLNPANLQLLFFGGKGGVGKTTCAVATALHWADRFPDSRFLLVSSDPAHSLNDSLAGMALPANLEVSELDAQQSLADFRIRHASKLHEIARRGTFLRDDEINQFLNLSLPGMDEVAALLEICRLQAGQEYQAILVDTAPTGHTLRLLAMPEKMRHWLDMLDTLLAKHRYMKEVFRGRYEQDDIDKFLLQLTADFDALSQLLGDQERCQFVPVMLAETLSLNETGDLLDELERQNIHAPEIVVNCLVPDNSCQTCSLLRNQQIKTLNLALPDIKDDRQLWGIDLKTDEVRGKALKTLWQDVFAISHTESTEISIEIPFSVDRPVSLPEPDQRLLLFAGKGGVGKTTLACATAMHLADISPDKKILLFSSDPAHSLADCLDRDIGNEPTPVMHGLDALEVDAIAEFEDVKSVYSDELSNFFAGITPNVDFTFDRRVMEQMMDFAPPGIDEIVALSSAASLAGQGDYELIIMDTAPTGHLVRLLELPEILDEWLKAMFDLFLDYKEVLQVPTFKERLVQLSRELKYFRTLLVDEKSSGITLVSIATEMAFAETTDLAGCCDRLGLRRQNLFLNLCTGPSDCALCTSVHERESLLVEKFSKEFPDMSQCVVFRGPEPRGNASLLELGTVLYLE